jgi:hypothetical protein
MIGILLILAALAITVALAVVLVGVIGASLRRRREAADGIPPRPPSAPAVPGRPSKPPLAPWLVISGILLVVLTAIGAASLEGCRALGRMQKREREEQECSNSLQPVCLRLAAYWDQNKQLPPSGAVAMTAACPLGNQFRYVGHRNVRLGTLRVLAVECDPHPGGDRHAVVVDQRFLDAKKAERDFQQGVPYGNRSVYVETSYPGSQHGYFHVKQISAGSYEGLRGAIEGE